MVDHETLQPQEHMRSESHESNTDKHMMTAKEVQRMFAERKQHMAYIQSSVSSAFYRKIEEKVRHEEEQFLEMFNMSRRKKDVLKKYSFVLDQHYFEQLFMKP